MKKILKKMLASVCIMTFMLTSTVNAIAFTTVAAVTGLSALLLTLCGVAGEMGSEPEPAPKPQIESPEYKPSDETKAKAEAAKQIEADRTEAGKLETDAEKHWAEKEMQVLKDKGVLADNTQYSDNDITAKEFIQLLSRVLRNAGWNTSNSEVYLDDKITDGAYADVLRALDKATGKQDGGKSEIKMILGNSDAAVIDNYAVPITREKAAYLIGAFVNDKFETPANIYNIVEDDWDNTNASYKIRINALFNTDILLGHKVDNIFDDATGLTGTKVKLRPKDNLTKNEAYAMLGRLAVVLD